MNGVDVEAVARQAVDDNVYMALSTADEAGRPWASPVFYFADAYRTFYWVSSPEVTHSRNLARQPQVSIVIFDSRAPIGAGGLRAVYLTATATEVSDDDLDRSHAVYEGFVNRGGRAFTPAELRTPAPYRLYRATVTGHSVLCPRPTGEPCAEHGLDYDHRTQVHLS